MGDESKYDVFLSRSSKDEAAVPPAAERFMETRAAITFACLRRTFSR